MTHHKFPSSGSLSLSIYLSIYPSVSLSARILWNNIKEKFSGSSVPQLATIQIGRMLGQPPFWNRVQFLLRVECIGKLRERLFAKFLVELDNFCLCIVEVSSETRDEPDMLANGFNGLLYSRFI